MNCAATKPDGSPCRAHAMRGSELCTAHLALGGRKSQLTADVTEKLVQVLRTGNYVEVACRAVNVPRRTFTYWMDRGRSSEPAEKRYRDFRLAIEEAQALGEVRLVTEISKAARENWQASAWMLERLHPERWARVSQRTQAEEPAPADRPADPFDEVDELAQRRHGRPTP